MAAYRAQGRASALRALLAVAGVLAALVLLGAGQLSAAAEPPGPAAAAASSGPDDSAPAMDAPQSAVLVRTAAVAALPAPTGPADGLLPGHGPRVAPHLVAQPQSRAPTSRLAAAPAQGTSTRAPPGPAGT